MIERTLILVKPDGVYRALIGKIITTFEDAGLKVVGIKMLKPSRKLVEAHYIWDEAWAKGVWEKTTKNATEKGIKITENYEQMGKRIRGMLIDYVAEKPVIAAVIEGNEAAAVVRKLVGATAPAKADPYSIRGRFSVDSYDLADSQKRAVANLVHASEDSKIAEREIAVWFKKEELVDYERADEDSMFLGR
ncbi:MAG: nucleoside-diphosphate kinase [Candidatus Micrarchaeaceae archaeon]